ncbi:MAG: trypsin-like peptidase domain-containing protein [Actinobacteria bacterium]|nr:trypsin-like peptidase domain-containing protein [Actinomycetota bacterium]
MAVRGRSLLAVATAIISALSLQGCVLDGSLDQFLDSPGIQPPSRRSTPSAAELDAPKVFRRATPAISTVISSFDSEGQATAIGTGFAVGDGQQVVTNAHVVTDTFNPEDEASEIYLQREDGTRVKAEVAGIDYHADIAVLDAEETMTDWPLEFAKQRPETGDPVMAIGSPLGMTYTMSVGYITGVDRAIGGLAGFKVYGALQTDAVIAPGNSGGPLLNSGGQVVGVNSQMLSIGGGGEGLGFALPASVVSRSVKYLSKYERVPYAYLGASGKALWRGAGDSGELPDRPGVLVGEVREGSPAFEVGLRGGTGRIVVQGSDFRVGGDLIIALDDHKLDWNEPLGEALLRYNPGDRVVITYIRDGERKRINVQLAERPLIWPSLAEVFGA